MVKVLKHIHIPNIVKKKSHKIITFWRNKQQKCFWAWIRSTLFLVVCYEAFLVGFLSQQMILQNQENIAWLTFLAIRFISDCMLQYKTLQVHIKRRISLAHTQENKKCTFYISTHLNLNKTFWAIDHFHLDMPFGQRSTAPGGHSEVANASEPLYPRSLRHSKGLTDVKSSYQIWGWL